VSMALRLVYLAVVQVFAGWLCWSVRMWPRTPKFGVAASAGGVAAAGEQAEVAVGGARDLVGALPAPAHGAPQSAAVDRFAANGVALARLVGQTPLDLRPS
jgi:hypothetical protein